jgi:hypothetical protein
LGQLPQLINFIQPWNKKNSAIFPSQTPVPPGAKGPSPEEIKAKIAAEEQQLWEQIQRISIIANLCVPPGWLPLGAMAVAEGNYLWVLACMFGMTLLGSLSLWRAYRTTVRMYTGTESGPKTAKIQPASTAPQTTAPLTSAPAYHLEKKLPGVSEQATAIALASFRSLVRAPEAKLVLMSIFIMMTVFGTMTLTRAGGIPEVARPLLPFGAMGLTLLSSAQLIGNQFGMDRSGFRVFVLSPARRGDILLGKNLAFAPLALGIGLTLTLIIEVVAPLRYDLFVAAMIQQVSMYLVFCLLANLLSIYAPIQIAAGSMKPVKMNLIPMLLYLLFTLTLPIVFSPILLPVGAEFVLSQLQWGAGIPTCLLLTLLEGAIIVALYRLLLPIEGDLLQAREQKILEIVTTKAE